jgi:hypothetical protein
MNVEQLREARKGASVAYMKFTRKAKEIEDTSKMLFCFVEGEDSKYYSVRVDLICKELESEFFKCNGKREVLKAYHIIQEHDEYKKHQLAYFVDRDFDETIRNRYGNEIYETPCYSIENLYTTMEAFKKIIEHEFKLSEKDNDYEKCLELFKERQKKFHEEMRLLNAWIAYNKELYNKFEDNSLKLNLNNLRLKNLVVIKLEKVDSKYDVEELQEKYSDLEYFNREDLNESLEDFKGINAQKWFRGKFEIEFLRIFVAKLSEEISSNDQEYFSTRKRVSLNLTKRNIISELSQYATTPNCLIDYLSRFNSSDESDLDNDSLSA